MGANAATAAFQVASATAASTVLYRLPTTPLVAFDSSLYAENSSQNLNETPPSNTARVKDYVNLIRPFTLVQAIGAFVVGCLSINTNPTVQAMVSIYLSYAYGMVANDVVDSSVDAMHLDKKNRAIAAGRISTRKGWIFCAILALLSCITVASNPKFLLWTVSNLSIMLLYALGLQKVFLVKNLTVGYLGISPLIGAVLVGATSQVCRVLQQVD
jgi:4-hydroxybenzoate polyprenyltransferase